MRLEAQLQVLLSKWRTSIADPSLLPLACFTAKQRWITAQYEEEQHRLRDQLLLQQLYLASVQVALTESPLLQPYSSLTIFQAIHDPIYLASCTNKNISECMERLVVRSALALKLAPSLVDKFVNGLVARATSLLPVTTTTVTADDAFTYVSAVSVSKIELASVTRVFRAVLTYFESLDAKLGAHYSVKHIVNVNHANDYSSDKADRWGWTLTGMLVIIVFFFAANSEPRADAQLHAATVLEWLAVLEREQYSV